MARYEHAGNAQDAALVSDIDGSATSFDITSPSNWPTGATYKFWVVIDPDTDSEEHLLGNTRSGSTITLASVADRGKEGTSAVRHKAGAVVRHIWSKTEADDLALLSVNNTFAANVGINSAPSTYKLFVNGDVGSSTPTATFTSQGDATGNGTYQIRVNHAAIPGTALLMGMQSDGRLSFAADTGSGPVELGYLNPTTPTSGQTTLYLLYHNGTATTVQRVTAGAADSGGTGFKLLRVPN